MLGFDKDKFTLVIKATPEQKKEAMDDYIKMNTKIQGMFNYLEKKETPKAEKDKYEPLAIAFTRTISEASQILYAMGIPVEEVRKHRKF